MPGALASTRVSLNGGTQPRWPRDGRELFYVSSSGHLMAVPINPRETKFASGRPNGLFALGMHAKASDDIPYAVSRDGARFLLGKSAEDISPSAPLTVVLGWAR
jgi:eukaryotic-like serine/threonine-protein kinase